jgi:protease-4
MYFAGYQPEEQKIRRICAMRRIFNFMILSISFMTIVACASPQIKLFSDATDPLQEFTIQGTEKGKVLVISIQGVISTSPDEKFLRSMPSMVQEVVAQLRMAEKDDEIQCLLLKVDSPGGTTTASDMLYNELLVFKKKTGKKMVVVMMDMAASGGYYISLPADVIVAHPTTVTGSIGVIFMRPKITGLMDKIGLEMAVNKSGENKDMGSPFRQPNEKEQAIFQGVTDELGKRFLSLVAKHRELSDHNLSDISTARIYLAEEALSLGLVDKIGYLDDALQEARSISGLSEKAKVIAYRRSEFPNDNLYNPATSKLSETARPLVDLGLTNAISHLKPGFYYIWAPALGM